MQPVTAIGLTLCAIAILFSGDNRRSPKGFLIPSVIAAIVLLEGLLILAEYMFALDLGIDRILIGGAANSGGQFPGRPAPQTSANFAVLERPCLSTICVLCRFEWVRVLHWLRGPMLSWH